MYNIGELWAVRPKSKHLEVQTKTFPSDPVHDDSPELSKGVVTSEHGLLAFLSTDANTNVGSCNKGREDCILNPQLGSGDRHS